MSAVADRAARRAAAVHQAAIRDALAEAAPHQALNQALAALQSEAAKVRRRRPADAALNDAYLAGVIAAIAGRLHAHKPGRPAGCPRVPRPADLLAMYQAGLESEDDS